MEEADSRDLDGGRTEDLYDAYVEAALRGAAPPPEEFLRGHGVDDAVLGDRLRRVHGRQRRRRPAAADVPFARLGRYRVLERLGEGGMGAVLLGEEEDLGRLVALKVLRPEFQGSATIAARFERESRVVARLRHPHIVQLYGVGDEAGVRFLAMEYVEGEGLDEIVARAREEGVPLPVETCVRWAVQIAGALQAVHDAGVVHRDVKPSNIRITPAGDAVLLDFGIAAAESAERLTRTGRFLGTVAYAAPEQLAGATDADARTDVWSLGVVLHEALAGALPFEGTSEADTIRRVLTADSPALSRVRPGAPRDLGTVLEVALEKDPARRYPSAAAFAADLRAVLAARPVSARRPGPVRRAARGMRRHPVGSVAVGLSAVALVSWAAATHIRRRADARDALALARASIETFRRESAAAREAEAQLQWLDRLVESSYMSAADDARHAAVEAAVAGSRRRREGAFHEALGHLGRAESLGVDEDAAAAVRGTIYLERWREARLRHDDDEMALYRQLARSNSRESGSADEVTGAGRVRIVCRTPGATARLFVHELESERVPGGEPRRVPVPLGGEGMLPPGRWALRLLADHGPLLAGDLVTDVGGRAIGPASWEELQREAAAGGRATVIGRQSTGDVQLPAGTPVRTTTQPLEWVPGAEVLDRETSVPAGSALLVVRARGYEEVRRPLEIGAGESYMHEVDLEPAGTTPPGYVVIHPRYPPGVVFRIRETEVTAAEYLEFLNDPATVREIDGSQVLVRVPRSPATRAAGGHWQRAPGGRFVLPDTWPPDWPALGVSFEDALAYCRWWTRRAAARGEPWQAGLPTLDEWSIAAGFDGRRLFAFGNHLRPKWVSSCYSLPRAQPVPVLSFPRDETVSGLFDTAGSVSEWVDAWWDEPSGTRRVVGGSWAWAPRTLFRVWGGEGRAPTSAGDEVGFRIVLHRAGPEDRR